MVRTVFYIFIGYLLCVFLHESLHVILHLCFGDKFIGANLNIFSPSVAFKSLHLNNPYITFIVCVGPLLVGIGVGIAILLLSSRIVLFQLRKLLIITGGVFVSQLCFQPLDIYYITGDIVNWTTSLDALLFLREYYWILLILCIPVIFFSIKKYLKALYSDVTSFSHSAKVYICEILIPIVICFLILNVGIDVSSNNADELAGLSLEGRYLYNKILSMHDRPAIISVSKVEDAKEINKIIFDRKFNDSTVVCFIENEPTDRAGSLVKYRGSIFNKGEIVRVDYWMKESGSGDELKLEVENIVPFNKTIPGASNSKIPAILMFGYYCIIALISVFFITFQNRKKTVAIPVTTP